MNHEQRAQVNADQRMAHGYATNQTPEPNGPAAGLLRGGGVPPQDDHQEAHEPSVVGRARCVADATERAAHLTELLHARLAGALCRDMRGEFSEPTLTRGPGGTAPQPPPHLVDDLEAAERHTRIAVNQLQSALELLQRELGV